MASHVPEVGGPACDFRHIIGDVVAASMGTDMADWRFKAAGFGGWLAVAAPTFVDIYSGRLAGPPSLAWMTAFLTFGATYAFYLRPASAAGQHRTRSLIAFSLLTAAGMVMVITSVGLMKYLASVTLTIVAGELPYVMPARLVWAWVMAQSAVLGVVFWLSFGWVSGVAGGFAYVGFQVLALSRAFTELRERHARQELSRVVAELRGTQALLSESSRVAERLRISRDLHDSMGHHLTALSLQLDVAARQLIGQDARRIHEAHAITRLLLADVRSVVGDLRAGAAIDVSAALKALASSESEPRVHVDTPPTLSIDTPVQANTLLRCAQEIVTNAVRHANARNVWIRITQTAEGIELHGHDDGDGAPSLVPGHGLRGMRERFEDYGGSLSLTMTPGQGLTIRAVMPGTEPTS